MLLADVKEAHLIVIHAKHQELSLLMKKILSILSMHGYYLPLVHVTFETFWSQDIPGLLF